jgi:hypothetical protein
MLDIRFAGAARFVVGLGDSMTPDNVDAPPASLAMASALLPPFPVQGIHWTRHERPSKPYRPAGSRAHLRVVK